MIKNYNPFFVLILIIIFVFISQVTQMLRVRQPYFSNLIEQDSGVVTAGMIDTRHSSNISEEDAKTDLYKPVFRFEEVKELMSKGVEEYNKIHPRIKLALYKVRKKHLFYQYFRNERILGNFFFMNEIVYSYMLYIFVVSENLMDIQNHDYMLDFVTFKIKICMTVVI